MSSQTRTSTTRPPTADPVRTSAGPSVGVAAAIYFGLSLIYFVPALLPFRHIFGTDYLAAGYFSHEFISDRLAAGALPKWVPFVYGGLPLFANPGSAYYPFRLLVDLVLPVSKLFAAMYVIQFGLAGLGMYLLAHELGCRRWVALVAGVAFEFTGLMMSYVYAGHEGRIIVATFAPLFLFFLHRGVRTGGLGAFTGAATTLGFALLSFQIQSAYYLLLAGAAWAVFSLIHLGVTRVPGRLARRVGLGLAAVAFGFLLAAVNFLPFLDYVDASPRGGEEGRGYEYSTSWSMPPSETVGLAVPEHAGILEHYQGDNPFKLHTEYVGALVIALLALGFGYSRRNRTWWFFLGLGAFMLTIAFGGYTPLYRLYYAVLPGTEKFRAPSISFFLVVLSLVSMAALTLERLAALRDESRPDRGGRRVRAGEADPFVHARWILGALVGISLLAFGVVSATAGAEPRDTAFVQGVGRFSLFLLLIAGALWTWLRGHLATPAAMAVLALVTVADLWVVDRKFFETTPPPAEIFAPDDIARFLMSQPQPARTWVLPFPAGAVYRNNTNYLMRFNLDQAGGEHGNQLQQYNEYVGAGERTYVDWQNFIRYPAFLDAANVRYIVSMIPFGLPGLEETTLGTGVANGTLREVHRGSALVYENLNALPRAYLVPDVVVAEEPDAALELLSSPAFDPRRTAVVSTPPGTPLPDASLEGEASITEYSPDRVVVRTQANRPALLVLADNYYQGWQVTVDGEAAPLLRTNHTFRGVVVGAGDHTVMFTFAPTDFYIGFGVYVTGFALLAGYGLTLLLRRSRARVNAGA